MEDPDYDEIVRHFRPLLEKEKDELRAASEGTSADRDPVELDQQSVGRLSRMDSMQIQAMAHAVEQRRRNRGVMIERAFNRMDEGEYGYCGTCGDFIGWRRLAVDPLHVQCVDCASGREK